MSTVSSDDYVLQLFRACLMSININVLEAYANLAHQCSTHQLHIIIAAAIHLYSVLELPREFPTMIKFWRTLTVFNILEGEGK